MTISMHRTKVNPPKGFTRNDPTDPDSAWSRDDLSVGCEYDVSYTPDGQLKVFAHGQDVGVEDIAASINDLIRFYSKIRTVQAELATRR